MKREPLVVQLGRYGFSYACIGRITGLDRWQIAYELREHDVRLREYRNGETKVAKRVIHELRLPTIKIARVA